MSEALHVLETDGELMEINTHKFIGREVSFKTLSCKGCKSLSVFSEEASSPAGYIYKVHLCPV